MFFLTEDRSSLHSCEKDPASFWEPQWVYLLVIILSLMDRLQRLDQSLEVGLRCMASQNPSSWSKVLFWIEYAHNTFPSQWNFPYPLRLWVSASIVSTLEKEIHVPVASAMIQWCCHVWVQAKGTLLKTSAANKKACRTGFTFPSTSARSSRWRRVVSIQVPPWQHSSNLLMIVLFLMFRLVCTFDHNSSLPIWKALRVLLTAFLCTDLVLIKLYWLFPISESAIWYQSGSDPDTNDQTPIQ